MSTIKIFVLYITSNSEMMLVESDKSLPYIEVSDPFKDSDLDNKLKDFVKEEGLKDISYDFSRYKLCNNTGSAKCMILKVSDVEKNTILSKSKKYKFYKTYVDDASNTRKINPELKDIQKETQDFFANFQYLTDKTGNPLDKCIKEAKEPKQPTETFTTTFKFYRPVFPLIIRPVPEPIFSFLTFPNNPVYPTVVSPIVVSPFVSPVSSRSSSPRDRRFDRYEPAPKVPRSPTRSESPKVTRSPERNRRQSPRRKDGGYYEKYLKYKTKYINLKNELNK